MRICNQPFETDKDLSAVWGQWPDLELSDFQKWAILALISGQHALIGAHTGSGKTLPAEFAIKYFTQRGKKVIYTTPLKAISNQKLYEFRRKYPTISFGLITGDNKFNPEADVLIMTTEILRNTLFRMQIEGSDATTSSKLLGFEMDIARDLAVWVCDEVHYINEPTRGAAVEEALMMMPKHVQLLMLSATLACPDRLCHFIEKSGNKEVWLSMTHTRVVPLQHYALLTVPPSSCKRLDATERKLVESTTNIPLLLKAPGAPFQEQTYSRITKTLGVLKRQRVSVRPAFVLNQTALYLKANDLLPAIFFVLSRRKVELYASKIQTTLFPEGSKIPSTVGKKCEQIIRSKFSNPGDYLQRPEYLFIISLLEKGVAIHHGGILKEYREMIEILFMEGGYIRLLVATETFAVGINVPAKTVVMPSLQKFDGTNFRLLKPHEYTQMAGRAGRRGMDICGHVFHLSNLFHGPPVPIQGYRHLFTGKSQPVSSKFEIHFHLLLRLIAAEDQDIRTFVKDTLYYDALLSQKRLIIDQLNKATDALSRCEIPELYRHSRDLARKYYHMRMDLHYLKPKQRKKRHREIEEMKDKYVHLSKDYDRYAKETELEMAIAQLICQRDNIVQYVDSEIQKHLQILEQEKFIETADASLPTQIKHLVTEKGHVATLLQEVHSLAVAELITEGSFDGLGPAELSAVLSCLTELRLRDAMRVMSIDSIGAPRKIREAIRHLQSKYDKYYDIETKHKTAFVERYRIHYDMAELVLEWCKASNESECNQVLANARQYEIVLGEFVKAILKINAITQELEKVCYLTNNTAMLKILTDIPCTTMKGCVTNQSLYL